MCINAYFLWSCTYINHLDIKMERSQKVKELMGNIYLHINSDRPFFKIDMCLAMNNAPKKIQFSYIQIIRLNSIVLP